MKKKTILIPIALLIFTSFLGVSTGSFGPESAQDEEVHFIFGTSDAGSVLSLDPTMSTNWPEYQYIDNVVEKLFAIDITSSALPIKGALAADYEYENDTSFIVDLQTDVVFHDGTDFNATAVKWNMDRLANINIYHGGVFAGDFAVTIAPYLEKLPELDLDWVNTATLPIINETRVIDEDTVKFILNVPYDMISLLTSRGASIISPTEHAGYENATLGIETLVGTGPFIFVEHSVANLEGEMWGNANYWQGAPYITNVTFSFIEDQTTRNNALISGDINSARGVNLETVNVTGVDIEELDVLSDNGLYLAFVEHNVPVAIRKALTHAFDYEYVLQELLNGLSEKAGGIIPKGNPWYTEDMAAPSQDLEVARTTLIEEGIAPAEAVNWSDTEWLFQADVDPLFNISHFFTPGDPLNDLHALLNQAARKCGGVVLADTADTGTWTGTVLGPGRATLDAYFLGWGPSGAKDPTRHLINTLEAGQLFNFAMLNDSLINEWVWDAMLETDVNIKAEILYNISHRIHYELYPYLIIDQAKQFSVLRDDWTGAQPGGLDLYYLIEKEAIDDDDDTTDDDTSDDDTTPTPTEGGIPSYPVFFLGLISMITLVLIKKKKH